MSDQEAPFASFMPSGEPPAEPAGKTRRGKRKGKDKSTRSKEAKAPAELKPDKLKRTRKVRQPRAMKIGLQAALVAVAGMSESDCHLLDKAAELIAGSSKKSRQRVVAALAKIFA